MNQNPSQSQQREDNPRKYSNPYSKNQQNPKKMSCSTQLIIHQNNKTVLYSFPPEVAIPSTNCFWKMI